MSAEEVKNRREDWSAGFGCVSCLGEKLCELSDGLLSLVIGTLPPGVREHVLNAGKETLLAVRGLVDEMIKRQDEIAKEVSKKSATLRRIKVE